MIVQNTSAYTTPVTPWLAASALDPDAIPLGSRPPWGHLQPFNAGCPNWDLHRLWFGKLVGDVWTPVSRIHVVISGVTLCPDSIDPRWEWAIPDINGSFTFDGAGGWSWRMLVASFGTFNKAWLDVTVFGDGLFVAGTVMGEVSLRLFSTGGYGTNRFRTVQNYYKRCEYAGPAGYGGVLTVTHPHQPTTACHDWRFNE
jgi:hypothetical protein